MDKLNIGEYNMTKKNEYKILSLACHAGKILLQNGAEVYRVENSVCQVAKSYGLIPQCFATLTCIIITLKNSDGEVVSLVERVNSRSTNLDKVYQVHTLLKNLSKYNYEELENRLLEIEQDKPYSFPINILGNCLGAGFFTFLFSGNFHEFIAAFLCGILVAFTSKITDMLNLGVFFTNLLCGAISSGAACIFLRYGFITDVSIPIISTLMILVPGVAFINSMRDLFSGDLVTGFSRLGEVVMIGTAIAVGSGIALKLLLDLGGV